MDPNRAPGITDMPLRARRRFRLSSRPLVYRQRRMAIGNRSRPPGLERPTTAPTPGRKIGSGDEERRAPRRPSSRGISRGLQIDLSLGELAEQGVGLLFFQKRLFEERRSVLHAE